MQKHMGDILEVAVRKSGISITTLAKRIGRSRQNLYDLFHQVIISDFVLIQKIGKAIQHDFSEEITELKNPLYAEAIEPGEGYGDLPDKKQIALLEEKIKTQDAQIEGWRERYRLQEERIRVMQENNDLLKENIRLLKGLSKGKKEKKALAGKPTKKLQSKVSANNTTKGKRGAKK